MTPSRSFLLAALGSVLVQETARAAPAASVPSESAAPVAAARPDPWSASLRFVGSPAYHGALDGGEYSGFVASTGSSGFMLGAAADGYYRVSRHFALGLGARFHQSEHTQFSWTPDPQGGSGISSESTEVFARTFAFPVLASFILPSGSGTELDVTLGLGPAGTAVPEAPRAPGGRIRSRRGCMAS